MSVPYQTNPEQVYINPDSKSLHYLSVVLGFAPNEVVDVLDRKVAAPDANGFSIVVYSTLRNKRVSLCSGDYLLMLKDQHPKEKKTEDFV